MPFDSTVQLRVTLGALATVIDLRSSMSPPLLRILKYCDGKPLRDHKIAPIMIAFLMAGQHTIPTSVSWTLLHLAQNIEVQETLHQEKVDHFNNSHGFFRSTDHEVFCKLPYALASAVVSQVDPRILVNPTKWDPTQWSDPQGLATQAFTTCSEENGVKIDCCFGAVSKGTVCVNPLVLH
ncbi:uncharacterized protein F5891DRAFT_976600 [Suillus fuscotomentosus]|uniref:Cytochrome P450 n=1 Tax=Suillus fuscotomentosus TaxID=1912939 RepID=A0AAD4EHF1_9AGAM|nr:uncharacterized protein F5891DRAFT_976600 [Suillus fuscotomentosus]KAG1905028.1 hypothetical protein F5891DRAFT_976600 [Suillus fuscotomentosus]